jgi:hypothetical protein
MRSPVENFMSAVALGLTYNEHRALITVLGMLERGEVKHYVGDWDSGGRKEYDPTSVNFNMAVWSSQHECDTVHCMGGFAMAICRVNYKDNTAFGEFATLSRSVWERMAFKALGQLFYPKVPYLLFKITVDQAASALRNYLTTGAPDWNGVLEL